MFSFIHAADLHLDSPLLGLSSYEDAPVERIRMATRQALINLVDYAIEQQVNFILLAGDIYDGDWKDYTTGLFFTRQMVRLNESNIPVFLVLGNHDAESRMTKMLKLPSNVYQFSANSPETKILEGLGVAIHGQSYQNAAVTEDISKNYPLPHPHYFNIGLLHTSADGREGHQNYAPCSVAGLSGKEYDYWALGHIHKHEVLCENPPIIFPGNIQGRHVKETGLKGCYHVKVQDDRQVELHRHFLQVVLWESITVSTDNIKTDDELIAAISEELEKIGASSEAELICFRVTIKNSGADPVPLLADRDRLRAEIRNCTLSAAADFWLEKVIVQHVSSESLFSRHDELFSFIGDELASALNSDDSVRVLEEDLEKMMMKLPVDLRSRISREEYIKSILQQLVGDCGELLSHSLKSDE